MSVTQVFPSANNAYVPTLNGERAQAALVYDFSRSVKKFKLNTYSQLVPVKNQTGLYVLMTVEEAGRLLDSSGADKFFGDGADRPTGHGGGESFGFPNYRTKRYSFGTPLGWITAKSAAWDIKEQYLRIYAQQAMTYRTLATITTAQTSGNWSGNTSAVGSISGVTGKWDISTTARTDIKRSLDYAQDQIRLGTLGAVEPGDMMLVMSPLDARRISVSQEIVDFIKGSTDARQYIEGKLGPNAQYGLPANLYGLTVVIEDAVRTTSRKGATAAKSYVCAAGSPFICSRPGGLMGVDGAPSFSTLTVFSHEEMTQETFDDPKHRRTELYVTDDFDNKVTAPVSGFLFTAATG